MANFPFNPPDSGSTSIGSESPVPDGAVSGASSEIDTAGFEWVEFVLTLTNNIGGSPITQLACIFEYRDENSIQWKPVTVEQVNAGTGVAAQAVYTPQSYALSGNDEWRIPVPAHGAEMRIRGYSIAGTPDPTSTVSYAAFRR